jgi:hypothetical protein
MIEERVKSIGLVLRVVISSLLPLFLVQVVALPSLEASQGQGEPWTLCDPIKRVSCTFLDQDVEGDVLLCQIN